MYIYLNRFCLVVLFAKPTDVVLLTCMGLGGWGYLSSLSVVLVGKASLAFRKVAHISVSASTDMTVFMICHRVGMALLLVGRVGGLLPFLKSTLATKKVSGAATCAFFIVIRRIAGDVEYHVA